jgi:NADH-quinone oxidoreductase subunit E
MVRWKKFDPNPIHPVAKTKPVPAGNPIMNLVLNADEKLLLESIKSELVKLGRERSKLIPALQLIQSKLGYLPPAAIHMVAEHLNISSSEVYGVATFYNQFRFNPPGRNPVKVCLGTACHVKGGDIILENFERKLEIKEGQTTPDREFSIDRVACVGCCALAPVAVVGETVHGHMQPSKVEGLILRARIEKEKQEREKKKNDAGE